jgi:tartrate-resistant acid phosphatase type 5
MSPATFLATVLVLCARLRLTFGDLNFLAIGDWGKVGADQSVTADAMARVASSHPVDFIVSVGDNFYEDGVNGVDDPQWKTTFQDVFEARDSLKNLPWYSVLGNHDYHQDPEAQIAYSSVSGGKWNMNGHFFTRTVRLGESEGEVKFIFIDSIWFAPLVSKSTHVEHQQSVFAQQYAWLESELKSSSGADWLIVVGHYPLFSVGENGDQPAMQKAIQALLEEYKVDAYISGHDHCLEHLTHNGVQYIVTGNGALRGKISSSTKAESLNFAHVVPGFTHHKISGSKFTTEFVSSETGSVIHSFSQTRRRVIKPASAFTQPSSSTSIVSAVGITVGVVSALGVVCGAIYFRTKRMTNSRRDARRYPPTEETPLVLII